MDLLLLEGPTRATVSLAPASSLSPPENLCVCVRARLHVCLCMIIASNVFGAHRDDRQRNRQTFPKLNIKLIASESRIHTVT